MAERDTAALLHEAMQAIAKEGSGVVLYLRRGGRGAEIAQAGSRRRPARRRASTRW